jgi:hypothetical protein
MKFSSATGATAFFLTALLGAAACGPDKDKSPGEKVGDAVEEAGEDIEEGAEEVGDEVDDATDDN